MLGIRNAWASGEVFLPGTVFDKFSSKKCEILKETGCIEPKSNLHVNSENDNTFSLKPSKVTIKIPRLDAYHLSMETNTMTPVYAEGPFNRWGVEKEQTWMMDKCTTKKRELYLDAADWQDELPYRFRSQHNILLDPFKNAVSILPGVGICSVIRIQKEYRIHIALSLNESFLDDVTEAERVKKCGRTYRIVRHPQWLKPDIDKITLMSEKPAGLFCTLFLTSSTEKNISDIIVFRDEKNKKSLELSVELNFSSRGILASPKNREIKEDRRVPWGASISVNVPFVNRGKGSIRLHFMGQGINQTDILTSSKTEPDEHVIPLRINTAKLVPGVSKKIRVRIRSDAQLANHRHDEISIRLSMARICSFPVIGLQWMDIPWGSSLTRRVEFYEGDTASPVAQVEASIPSNLEGILTVQTLTDYQHALLFTINTDSFKYNDQVEGNVGISAKCEDGLSLSTTLPVFVTVTAPEATIQVSENGPEFTSNIRPEVRLDINNHGPHALVIYSIYWEKGFFKRQMSLSDRGMPENRVIDPGQSADYIFVPRKTPGLILPKRVRDVINVKSNNRLNPRFSHQVQLKLRSKIGL